MIPYLEKQDESKQTNKQPNNRESTSRLIPQPIVVSQDVLSADPAHGESPPPIDYDLKVVKPVLTPFLLDRYPIGRKENK